MKVTMNTIDALLREIGAESENVHQGVVRMRTDTVDVNGEKCVFKVSFWAGCVIAKDDGDYLVEFSTETGIDERGIDDYAGSEAALEMATRIERAASDMGLNVRHGKIELE